MRVAPQSALLGDRKQSSMFGRAGDDGEVSSQVREVPLSRGMIGRDGSVRFRIDVKKALADANTNDGNANLNVVKLKFRHVDTGAVLELRLPVKKRGNDDDMEHASDGEIEFCGTRKPDSGRNGAPGYLMDDHDAEEEDDGPNEYEEDGFVV